MPKVLKSQLQAKKQSSDNTSDFPVEHYSASSLIKFSTNPILFKINYVNRTRFETTSGISSVLGSAFHRGMEAYYSDLKLSESDALKVGLTAAMEFMDGYNEGFIEWSKNIPTKQKALDLVSYIFNEYVKCMPYEPQKVLAVEEELIEKINVEWKGKKLSLPVKLKGKLDLIIQEDKKLKIKDYKTCYQFSNPDKIDGAKIIQAVEYYLLAYAKYGIEPYSVIFEEVKYTKNADGSKQVKQYEIIFSENELFFDFYFRLYEDVTRALNGEMVFVPNVHTLFDNEVSLIAYIHRLDEPEEAARLMKKHKVKNVTELLKKEIQNAGNMRKLMKTVESTFVSAKSLNYEKMNNQEKIQTKLMEHGMMLQFDSVINGASVDLYRFSPSIGLKMSRIRNYVDDIEQVLGVSGVRVLAPIPNSTMVGFEIASQNRTFPNTPTPHGSFDIAIGQTITGEVRKFDIREAPHMLVAGASGSGKSVFLNSMISQLSEIPNGDLHLFDPKMVELSHHTQRVVEYQSDAKEINKSLSALVEIMNARYVEMAKLKVKNIESVPGMPYKFVVVDEFGDLILSESVQNNVLLLAQKGRAAGIHMIIATQRPSVDVIKGTIKANFPVKVVFKTAKSTDSRVVLDEDGAEKLLGKGDMLFAGDHGIERLQGYNA